ncbi:flavin-containing monooxygenase [Pararhizobium sp. DWP3-4]|uniref:flavin-containing monooxygenase n=1 Tax=Pararhizobium sp. DWP3-4 TaxID=2804565 RepID=UPI003CED89A3
MTTEFSIRDVVVIGGGLSGLTAAHALKLRGIDTLILEKENDVGMPWARRHPQLTLNTHRDLSSLPGLKYPVGTGAFPKRDSVVAHLRDFREKHGFDIQCGVEVFSCRKVDGHFVIETNAGIRRSRHLIVASGRYAFVCMPKWKGLDTFKGRVVHAADFGDAMDYTGKSVLVIGGGNSGFDVLNHLSRVKTGQVWLSLRRPPGLLPKRLGRFAVHRLSPIMAKLPTSYVDKVIGWTQQIAFGDLTRYGFPAGPSDAATRLARDNIAIAVDDGAIAGVKRGQILVVPEVVAFLGTTVTLADRRTLEPDVVIAAVGYSSSLTRVLGPMGVVGENGSQYGVVELDKSTVEGLWFVGMKPSLTSYFVEARREAKSIAFSVAAMLANERSTKQ